MTSQDQFVRQLVSILSLVSLTGIGLSTDLAINQGQTLTEEWLACNAALRTLLCVLCGKRQQAQPKDPLL